MQQSGCQAKFIALTSARGTEKSVLALISRTLYSQSPQVVHQVAHTHLFECTVVSLHGRTTCGVKYIYIYTAHDHLNADWAGIWYGIGHGTGYRTEYGIWYGIGYGIGHVIYHGIGYGLGLAVLAAFAKVGIHKQFYLQMLSCRQGGL